MAFSFRAGTNWCHDFPKLARESGFYFNMHRTRVRVDWNRICALNIDQVIQESDFQTVDDNVNNVIDYSLEHEYDVKILDPNFVKLFRLAQLAVEYLLYCKQYLDQSVIILKDELKLKIEENVKLKKEIVSMADCIKELKERNKSIELRISPHGEVHKCPYCPKSFISAMYVNAHITRRHSTSSPVPDEIKNETERLHNEIKTLKERLNQTEKLINESNKWNDTKEPEKIIEMVEKVDKAENTDETSFNSHKSERLTNLPVEINKSAEDTNAALLSELKLRLENDLESVQKKLTNQENYWKAKMETLESQHHQDIENLFSQLKLTQNTASRMKSEYEFKIKDLERQSLSQSEMISAQTEMLHNLSRGIEDCKITQTKLNSTNEEFHEKDNGYNASADRNKQMVQNQSSQEISESTEESSEESSLKAAKQKPQQKITNHFNDKAAKTKSKTKDVDVKERKRNDHSALIDEFVAQTAKQLNLEKSKQRSQRNDTESCSEEQSESDSESEESESSSETKTETDISETVTESVTDDYDDRVKGGKENDRRRENPGASDDLKEDMREIFNRKMQNLGIDPDWEGIPKATFKQKSNILRHHQSINAKKYPKYGNIRERLLLELSKKLTTKRTEPKKPEPPKQGLLSKVKMKAMKAFNIQRSAPKSPIMQKQIIHPRRPDSRQIFGSSRARKMSLDEAELKRTMDKEFSLRASDSRLNHHRSEDSRLSETPTKVQKHASYETIEDFIRGSRKLEMSGSKVTSTPTKNVKNVVEESYDYDTDNVSMSSDVPPSPPMSPKSSKSVLKTQPSSAGASIKKRVEFDLDNRRNFTREPIRASSFGEVTEFHMEKRNSLDSDLNISSISDERPIPKRPKKVIVTSRKETSISDTSVLSSPTVVEVEDFDRSSTTNVRSPFRTNERNTKVPQAAPRNLNKNSVRTSVSEISSSNIEADIEEILQIT